MSAKAAVTVHRTRDEVERLWNEPGYRPEHVGGADAAVSFREAPGGRGTEIHVDLMGSSGRLGEVVQRLTGPAPLAKVKDDLRHFKQLVETGEIPRSDATPEGESVGRKLRQRPAQPPDDSELGRD